MSRFVIIVIMTGVAVYICALGTLIPNNAITCANTPAVSGKFHKSESLTTDIPENSQPGAGSDVTVCGMYAPA